MICTQGEHTHAAPPLLHQHGVRSSHARRSTGLVRLLLLLPKRRAVLRAGNVDQPCVRAKPLKRTCCQVEEAVPAKGFISTRRQAAVAAAEERRTATSSPAALSAEDGACSRSPASGLPAASTEAGTVCVSGMEQLADAMLALHAAAGGERGLRGAAVVEDDALPVEHQGALPRPACAHPAGAWGAAAQLGVWQGNGSFATVCSNALH